MYPRQTQGLDRGAPTGTVQFTAARARELRKENAARAEGDGTPAGRPHTIRRALGAANTAIIGNTLDFPTLSVHDLSGTAVSPETVLAGLNNMDVYYHLWVAAREAIQEHGGKRLDSRMVQGTIERFMVELGAAMHARNEGPLLTFVDPRRNDDAAAMVRTARRMATLFRARGMTRREFVISIPATEDGVAAAKELEGDEGIHTNLILVASLMHAAICAEAGATTISIAVGPLLHCHERKRNAAYQDLSMHPGIEIIQATLAYFKLHEIRTKLVGRDFRELSELSALPGFDAVCLSKAQLDVSLWKAETRSAELPDTTPQASMRARQAQHPTTLLENGIEFMGLMSAEARDMLAASMFPALGKMEAEMNAIEKIVKAEVAWQLALKTLGLEALYELRGAPPSSPEARTRRNRESDRVGARAGTENRRPPLPGEAWERENEGGLIEGVEYF